MLLVDDHNLVRAGMRALLEREEWVEVIGEAGDGHSALDLIKKLQPEVVLLDLMSSLTGFEVLKITSEKFPQIHVLVVSRHHEEGYAFRALRAGAAGYLPKTAAYDELSMAIKYVVNGGKYIPANIEQKAINKLERNISEGGVPFLALTSRQRQVLTLIAEGHCTKNIARTLNISVKTVESHRGQLMDRLNIHGIARLVRYAIKMGLVSLDYSKPKCFPPSV